jgi:hypothetical protein
LDRLTIFAKGNLDVRDTLHALRVGGEVRWNGVNEIVRARHPSTVVRVRHETLARSDMLVAADGVVPAALAGRELPFGPYSPASQYGRALFEAPADAYVLSIQPDIATQLWRHRRDGFLFLANEWGSWSAGDRQWLHDGFERTGAIDVDASMRNYAAIVGRLREASGAPVLVYNVSSVVPGDTVHSHQGLGETLATRIRRFNVALADLSARTGVSIVDVDAIVARAGADRLKLDAFHLNAEGCRLVAQEVVRILEDLGVLAAREAARC